MTKSVLGRKKVVYNEGDITRAIRGIVTIQDGFVVVKSDRNRDPIWINKNAVLTIKNIM